MKIKGGFYIKAKCIQGAAIMHAPPHVREIWDWLLMNAMFTDGDTLKKGQVLTSYDAIREGLCWYVGYRKERYTKWQCEFAMKWLTKEQMVTTTKTTRGFLVTICKYDYYQTYANYENNNLIKYLRTSYERVTKEQMATTTKTTPKSDVTHEHIESLASIPFNESHNASHNDATMMPQGTAMIDKEVKEVKAFKEEKKKKEKDIYGSFLELTPEEHGKLSEKYGNQLPGVIDFFNLKIESKGIKAWRKEHASDYATILFWDRNGWIRLEGGPNGNRNNRAGSAGKTNGYTSAAANYGDGQPFPCDLEVYE